MSHPAMHAREDYDRAVAVVRDIIHAWDPYALVGGCGAPADEWDGEIARIVARIPHIASEEDATLLISNVFAEAFQPEEFRPSDCVAVGRRLFSVLISSGLLAGS
jgi:hypothetical protein